MKRLFFSMFLVNVLYKIYLLLVFLEVGYRFENIDCDFIYEYISIVYCMFCFYIFNVDLLT